MIFFLENWRLVASALLLGVALLFGYLWRSEANDFNEYRGQVSTLGKAAQVEADRIEKQHQQTVKDISNAFNDQLQPARDNAMRAYRLAHPVRLPVAGGGEVRGPADRPQGADGASQEQVAAEPTCQPDKQFIEDSAEDALMVGMWQYLAVENGLKVE